MKALKKIIVLLLLLIPISNTEARINSNQEKYSPDSDSSMTLLEQLNIEQFRGLSYTDFIKKFPRFWLFSMDYDENNAPRRIMKAPAGWEVEVNGLIFRNLAIVFVNNHVEQIILSGEENKKKDLSVKRFISKTFQRNSVKVISKSDRKIVARLQDKYETMFECYFPIDYHEPDINIFISMK
jgi:hypothetical protein